MVVCKPELLQPRLEIARTHLFLERRRGNLRDLDLFAFSVCSSLFLMKSNARVTRALASIDL